MIPICFSNPDIKQSNTSHHQVLPQNLITCIYQTQICKSQTYLTLTWSKTLFSHCLTIYSPDSFSITISLYPSTFSFFRNRPGSKSIYQTHHHYQRIKLYWDFTHAEFTRNSAEPDSCFYVGISCDERVDFFLGDLETELTGRTGFVMDRQVSHPILLSKREHVFGHKSYITRAQLMGCKHEIGIECTEGVLRVSVDGETRVVVKRLDWKFRGNEKIFIGGIEVDFYWDVFNWVNCNDNIDNNRLGQGHGVFIFQVGDGGVWPEMVGPEKSLMKKSMSSAGPASTRSITSSPSPSNYSVLQWAEESSDCGRSSCSSSTRSYGSNGGFSLLLYAWKKDCKWKYGQCAI